ncbi:hypothetical protein FRB96_008609 [Tulasnella sp. 330]|nr:hypothetical protein FRB96_008609 [Tulasnella sp. 330]KAG8879327.1 hypothetical protein FRB97_001755 [Tulasnella sp. 331]KAG8879906.1 hypothetical protein FRB98_005459 [Tulasnella sp. 332]
MHPNTRPPSPPPDSGWRSIRPYTPRLDLSTCEITSVSATFVLKSHLDATYLKKSATEDDAQGVDLGVSIADQSSGSESRQQGITEVLRPGLVVRVNEEPWSKVVITKDEEEEAIVTVYDLDPATFYDIDLFVASGEDGFSGSIVTAGLSEPVNEEHSPQQITPEPVMPGISAPFQTLTPESTPPATPRRRSPSPPPPRLITVEERLAQVRGLLATSLAERDSLQMQVKLSRKESQRADTAIRSEIEVLKRASEKNTTLEVRNKQKLLALQQSVKHLTSATEVLDDQNRVLAAAVPELEGREKAVSEDYAHTKEEMERSATETEDALKVEKKRTADLEEEVAALDKELERLNVQKNRLHDDTLPALESRLAGLAKEIDAVEKGSAIHLPLDYSQDTNKHTHYYSNTSPGASSNYQNLNYRIAPPRSARLAPIQRPPTNYHHPMGNPMLSTSQRSLESTDSSWINHYNPQNPPIPSFPQIRHPSLPSHPAPRGLFVNNSGFQKLTQPSRSELDTRSRMSSSSSVNVTAWPNQNEYTSTKGHSSEHLLQHSTDKRPPPMRRPSIQLATAPSEQNKGRNDATGTTGATES